MTSEYPVLDNRPIDKWKVTELKEELKRRKLATRGLKDELVRRLDEALRAEIEDAGEELDNSVNNPEPEVVDKVAKTDEAVAGKMVKDVPISAEKSVVGQLEIGFSINAEETVVGESVAGIPVNAEEPLASELQIGIPISAEETVVGESVTGIPVNAEESLAGELQIGIPVNAVETVVGESDVGTTVIAEETAIDYNSNNSEVQIAPVQVDVEDRAEQPLMDEIPEQKETELVNEQHTEVEMSSVIDVPCEAMDGVQKLQDYKPERDNKESRAHQDSDYTRPPHEDVKLDSADPNNQVSEVNSNLGFPLKSNSNSTDSTDSISICEKKELEDNVIADDVKLETDVKPEMVQPSSSDLVPDGGESHPTGVEEPLDNELSVEGRENNVPNADISQKNLSASLGSSEKLNLDRSSGDDSMEEDALESKQIDSNYNTGEVGVMTEKSEVTDLKEEVALTAMDTDFHAVEKGTPSGDKEADKRKLPDQEFGLLSEPSKRQRRWKSEGNNIKENPQISNITPTIAAKNVPKSASQIREVSGSGSHGVMDSPKEREVPASTKAATNSIRIDNFLRPFTLKAVQDLLGKTGNVASFWMDHIKTHCYVTYSTLEEAVATRNAVYNLQWPPNGGRYLVADFVDPKEVKTRADPTIAPTRPAANIAPELPPKKQLPSPRQQDLRQQLTSKQTTLPPPPPPPPLSNSLPARERVHPIPPPPPPEDKEEAPILTLDDLFRKTKTTPRIYYLPLSEEQASSILEARQKNSGQPVG